MCRERLQVVVIDLGVDENAQEIFETLNARMTPLHAVDLIKNLVFQRLMEEGADVDAAYQNQWRDFESAFWEAESGVGRVRYPRSAVFLNQWLIARAAEEVSAREVFQRFKRYCSGESGLSMKQLVDRLARASTVYRQFVEGGTQSGPLD